MITDREGIRNHVVLHDFEIAHQRLSRLGSLSPEQAIRASWYMAFRLAKTPDGMGGFVFTYNHKSAWEAANEMAAQQKGERP